MGRTFKVIIVALLGLYLTMALPVLGVQMSLPSPFGELYNKVNKSPDLVLQTLLKMTKPDSINSKADFAYYYVLANAQISLTLPQESLTTATKALQQLNSSLEPRQYHAMALVKADALDLNGRAEEGIDLVKNAKRWATENEDVELLINAMFVEGQLSLTLSHLDGAMDIYLKAKELAKKHPELYAPQEVDSQIALIYEYQKNPAAAIPYFESALQYYREQNEQLQVSTALYGLGRAQTSVGNVETGLAQLKESADIAQSIRDYQGVAYANKEIARILMDNKQYEEAQRLLEQAHGIFSSSKNPYMIADTAISLAILLLETDKRDQAEHYVNVGKQYSSGASMDPHALALNRLQSRIYALNGEYKAAYDMLSAVFIDHQRFEAKTNRERLDQLHTKYAVEQTENQNRLLQEQNTLQQVTIESEQQFVRFITIVTILLLIVCSLLFGLYQSVKQQRRRLELIANQDGLTGLHTRRRTFERLNEAFILATNKQTTLTVAILDLDLFKQINDIFGHHTGDEVLKMFGEIATSSFSQTDIIGRIGGEEFLFAFPATSIQNANDMMKLFSKKVERISERLSLAELHTSVSVGMVEYTTQSNLDSLLADADKALYLAKSRGRNQIVLYSDEQ